ncbi:sterile alpha motif domain-containing protein 9-like [Pseudoliparis swirei]|uniref:sterile alpha motif domain-containing protein 9-like n=1 Tax=Pseudoliparis swirei TaxID=2059687 RepID=UPI0024BE3DE2|nr:sterile alpha motif domain-containing protein 9-like [Pseudoliparis swirei]XP_056290424.1 sterile alpha motif domain-containing protein 9-like [Pseudoliparis swirei]
MAEQVDLKSQEDDRAPDMKDWSKHQVREWILTLRDVIDSVAELLVQHDVTGPRLLLLDTDDFKKIGVTFGPAQLLIHARDELVGSKPVPGGACKPYPFGRYDATYRYIKCDILDVIESGPSDLIEPCHEYKAFNNTLDDPTMTRSGEEVIRFVAACMNRCTNGTIHFGIGDEPYFKHGQVLGVVVQDKEAYAQKIHSAIDHFDPKQRTIARLCIRPPRFVEVLNRNDTFSDRYVIEVDIVPDSTMCGDNIFHTFNLKKGKKKGEKQLFFRNGGSSRDLHAAPTSAKLMAEYNQFVDDKSQLVQFRKQAEEKHLNGTKSSTQGFRLSNMITGGSLSLDESCVHYVIVTNKSHPSQLKSLEFIMKLNPLVVLDFDPESAKNGLQYHFKQQSTCNDHSPVHYKITEGVEDIAKKLKLTQTTSWVFCNGRIEDEAPSDIEQWSMDKGSSVQDVVSFFCRKDVLPNKSILVIFLLYSTVSREKHPLVETFRMFHQELKSKEQILCICDNNQAFTSWKNLVDARCGINIAPRCIYELSFAEVNGTILSLSSKKRSSCRFLPCGGGSNVLLEKDSEHALNTLEVLCVNQCEGGKQVKKDIEENFYRGGQVSWWNFYFSEQPGSSSFIKRDKIDLIINTVIPDLASRRKVCVLFNLMHLPGCGGTTLTMNILWDLRHQYRCAVLRDKNADFAEVADQVVKLVMSNQKEKLPCVPVLLMIDDFDEKAKVFDLQRAVDEECTKNIRSKSAQVILLNCMTSESSEQPEQTEETIFIGNTLSEREQKLFADTFYGFMTIKKNLKPEYVEGVVRNTLKSFDINHKHAQLLAVLVWLNKYYKDAFLTVLLIKELLGFQPKPVCVTIKVEEGFGTFSTLIATCSVQGDVKMIHPSVARRCLQELTKTHNVTEEDFTDLLRTLVKPYESMQGKDQLLQKRIRSVIERQSSFQCLCIFPTTRSDWKHFIKWLSQHSRKHRASQRRSQVNKYGPLKSSNRLRKYSETSD